MAQYTEDDTFERLRQLPFKEMRETLNHEIDRNRELDNPSVEVRLAAQRSFLKVHGWEYSDYIAALNIAILNPEHDKIYRR